MVAGKSKSCAVCLQLQEKLVDAAMEAPATIACEAGMCDTAVPVKLGEKVVGFLQTGQIFRKKPTETQFKKVVLLTKEWGLEVSRRELHEHRG